MNAGQDSVGYLKKIGLVLKAGTSETEMNIMEEPFNLNFIYGVGTDGISLFEKALFDKRPGDEILFEVPPCPNDDIFGHLNKRIHGVFTERNTGYFLKVRVALVDTPDEREIIRAISDNVGADGCDCGCGFGC